jgi:hypothetical protein
LVWNAEKGIVMSWGVEGQGGFYHINTHNNDYVIDKVERYGFKYNYELTKKLRQRLNSNFKASLMVFDRE